MALGKFMKMIEGMLGAGKYQIAGEADIFDTKAEADAVLFERGQKMEAVWYPADDISDAPEWATKIYYIRTRDDHRRVANTSFVFVE